MLKEIQITLYDIFGYLLPGAVMFLSITLLFHTLFWPSNPLKFPSQLSTGHAVVFVLLAYLIGHLTQGIGNLFEKLPNVEPVPKRATSCHH